ncbi:MAG: exosortase, partial [Thermodesulfobacteriota bacterium]|nr:exosortase [Thermodesulfobacteriota bacterium]
MSESRIDYGSFFQYIFTLSIIACLFLAYWPVLHKMSIRWSAGDNSYCYLIVPLFLYLCWDGLAKRGIKDYGLRGKEEGKEQRAESKGQRAEGECFSDRGQRLEVGGKGWADRGDRLEAEGHLPQTSNLKPQTTEGFASDLRPNVGGFRFGEFSWSVWGLVPVILSILLIIIGEIGSVETLLYTGIWGCAVGMILVLYGRRIRYLIFPLGILLFIVPLPPFINRTLTFQLKLAASKLSTAMLRASGVSVLREGNIIDLGVSQLQVVDACSGLRYLMPLFLMALLVGYFFNKRAWQRAILILVVVPLSIFVNSIRIWVTGLLTVKGYQELAQSFFHDFSG